MLIQQNQGPQSLNPKQMSADQIELIKRTICKGATDDELKLFLSVCDKKQLDPFTNQIHAVKRWNSDLRRMVMNFQTSIDGLRLIAERSGKYAGQLGPFWCDDEGNWADVWLLDDHPFAAKVAVLRTDFKEPLWAVPLYKSFVQRKKDGTPNKFWSTMGEHQIAKVAEAQAIRRAFPQETSGLYIADEIQQAEIIEPSELEVDAQPITEVYVASNPQKQFLCTVLKDLGIENVGVMAEISRRIKDDNVYCDADTIKQWCKVNLKEQAE